MFPHYSNECLQEFNLGDDSKADKDTKQKEREQRAWK